MELMQRLRDLNSRFENRNRIIWYKILGFFLRNKRLDDKLSAGSIRKALFLRHDAIGDMIVSLPMFALLKEINPSIEIHVLASPLNAGLLKHDPNVDKVIIYHGKLRKAFKELRALRENNYDVIFSCLMTKISKNGYLANIIGSPGTIKAAVYNSEIRWAFFNKQSRLAAEKDSMWEKMATLVLDTVHSEKQPHIMPYMAIDAGSERIALQELHTLGLVPKKFLAINISTRNERNLWREDGYKFVIEQYLRRFPQGGVLILWMGDDEYMAKRLAAGFTNNVHAYRATGDIMEIISVVKAATAVLSPDTGVIHMCSAVKTPVVGMYVGLGSPAVVWKPFGVPSRALETSGDKYVYTISEQRVWQEVDSLLTEIHADF